jgi:8-hydroxy-5-deazaflavin:NADPH oxidoreductase
VAHVLGRYGSQLDGKIVVDITNPLDVDAFEPITLEAGSGAQETAATAPGARVVNAFNTTFVGTLLEGQVSGHPLDVFLASDDDEAKAVASRLASDGGLRPVDAGPLRRARELEALGYLHMAIQQNLGSGFGSTIKVLA